MSSNHHSRTENLSAVLCSSGSTIQHEAVGMHTLQTITALKKNPLDKCANNCSARPRHCKLPRLPLDEMHNTVTS